MTTDAQSALAQVREALAAGPTPGEWVCYDDSSDGKTNRIEIAAIGKTVARIYRSVQEQDLPNARLIAACSPANIAAILAHVDAQAAEIERLRAERDSIAIENSKFMDQIERLRAERDESLAAAEAAHERANHWTEEAARYHGERDELRRQLAEAEQDARRYRWIAGHCRSTSEQWGGRWSIVVEGPCPAKHDEEDAFDDAIDAAMGLTRPAEEA